MQVLWQTFDLTERAVREGDGKLSVETWRSRHRRHAARAAADELPPRPGDEAEVDLREYLHVVFATRWLVAAVTAARGARLAYAFLATPTYRSDTLLQVEQKNSGLLGLGDLGEMLWARTPAETEIEILRSRSLVGGVVDELSLDVEVRPKRFPVIGGAIARAHGGDGPRTRCSGCRATAGAASGSRSSDCRSRRTSRTRR